MMHINVVQGRTFTIKENLSHRKHIRNNDNNNDDDDDKDFKYGENNKMIIIFSNVYYIWCGTINSARIT